jgi:hypothetical protein
MEKNNGLSLSVILFVVFLTLKLSNVINWSWWWVTSPLWIPFVLMIIVILIVVVIGLISVIATLGQESE